MAKPIVILGPGEGRAYEIGPFRGVFKADEGETKDDCSVSEWSVKPHSPGPGAHHHDANDEMFFVTEGTMHFLIGEEWIEAPRGTYVQIPAGVTQISPTAATSAQARSTSSSPVASRALPRVVRIRGLRQERMRAALPTTPRGGLNVLSPHNPPLDAAFASTT